MLLRCERLEPPMSQWGQNATGVFWAHVRFRRVRTFGLATICDLVGTRLNRKECWSLRSKAYRGVTLRGVSRVLPASVETRPVARNLPPWE